MFHQSLELAANRGIRSSTMEPISLIRFVVLHPNSHPEYHNTLFPGQDEVLDLREEYIKDVTMEQCNVNLLSTTWMAEAEIAEDLIAMHNNVCDGKNNQHAILFPFRCNTSLKRSSQPFL